MDDFVNIFERPYRPLENMSKEEMQEELTQWRNLWTWIPEGVQWWLTRVRSEIRCVTRGSKTFTGLLGKLTWELKAMDVDVFERDFNYYTNEATYEHKTATIPLSTMQYYEFIRDKEIKIEKQNPFAQEPKEEGLEQEEVIGEEQGKLRPYVFDPALEK